MDPVVSLTKQGVRNLNNLGPKKPKVVATAEAPEQVGEGVGQPAKTESAAPSEAPATETKTE